MQFLVTPYLLVYSIVVKMPRVSITPLAAVVGAAVLVRAQTSTFPEVPLASKHFNYPDEIVGFL